MSGIKNKSEDLRNHLFATLEALQDDDNPMDIERAKTVAHVAGKVIDLAKVEVDYVRATGADRGSDFLEHQHQESLPSGNGAGKRI